MTGLLFAGIDVGSSATKAVIIDQEGATTARAVVPSGFDFGAAGRGAFEEALGQVGVGADQVTRVLATGYGRKNLPFATLSKTEISCHARGAHALCGEAITVVDIGGQDNKIICLDAEGRRTDFKLNRKCAAGTGAFLEEIAHRIGVPLSQMESLARRSTETVEIGSFCTVFSATEILGLIRRGTRVEDIVKGVFRSVARRVAEMAAISGKVVATGGVVAHNPIVNDLLAEALGTQVVALPYPQFTGALGAALYARELPG